MCAVGSGDVAGQRMVDGISVRVMPVTFERQEDTDVLEAATRMAEIAPPIVDRIFLFENVSLAYAYLAGRRVGRVVIRIS